MQPIVSQDVGGGRTRRDELGVKARLNRDSSTCLRPHQRSASEPGRQDGAVEPSQDSARRTKVRAEAGQAVMSKFGAEYAPLAPGSATK